MPTPDTKRLFYSRVRAPLIPAAPGRVTKPGQSSVTKGAELLDRLDPGPEAPATPERAGGEA